MAPAASSPPRPTTYVADPDAPELPRTSTWPVRGSCRWMAARTGSRSRRRRPPGNGSSTTSPGATGTPSSSALARTTCFRSARALVPGLPRQDPHARRAGRLQRRGQVEHVGGGGIRMELQCRPGGRPARDPRHQRGVGLRGAGERAGESPLGAGTSTFPAAGPAPSSLRKARYDGSTGAGTHTRSPAAAITSARSGYSPKPGIASPSPLSEGSALTQWR